MRLFIVGLVALFTVACATPHTGTVGTPATGTISVTTPSTTKALVVSGASLAAVGQQFADVSVMYTNGCKNKQITVASCAAYRTFGLKFKSVFPQAVKLWTVARNAGDAATVKSTEAVIIQLAADLSVFSINAITSLGGK